MRAIRISETGGPEVMELVDIERPEPGRGELGVSVEGAGVNFIDVYHRIGLYPMELPLVLGLEGAGTVTSVGPHVTAYSVGDRVAWTRAIGSYAESAVVPASAAVPVPADVPLDVAGAAMLQGLTAEYLVNDTYPLGPDDTCLVHAGAGGVGRLLIQMAKAKGATVYATAGTREKADMARSLGADHVTVYTESSFRDEIESDAGPHPLDVVYDGVGAATFDDGLALLRRRGMMVSFGNASGPVPPVNPLALSGGGSLFLTRPTLFDYIETRDRLLGKAAGLFRMIGRGELDILIGKRYRLDETAEAHRDLESRATTGKLLLVP